MQVGNVTQDDGRNCAHLVEVVQFATKLLDAFKLAGITVSGPGLNNRDSAARWLGAVAQVMAVDIRNQEAQKAPSVQKVPIVKAISAPQRLTSSRPKTKKSPKKK